MHRVWQRVALAIAGFVLAGCAAKPGTQVVLLPQADGSRSAVQVQTDTTHNILAEPFQRLQARQGDDPIVDTTTADDVHQQFAPLFAAAPRPPIRSVVFFQAGGTALTTESLVNLAQTLDEALRRSGAELVVTGHTDTRGSLTSNDALSLRRAQQVREMYIERGFPPARIEAVGRGERELAVPTPDETDEPRNRRVVILVR